MYSLTFLALQGIELQFHVNQPIALFSPVTFFIKGSRYILVEIMSRVSAARQISVESATQLQYFGCTT